MANYYASARSNYFSVNDEASFRKWAELWSLGIFESDSHPGKFAIYDNGPDACGWPSVRYDEETGEVISFDWSTELAPHLRDGEVAIMMEAGAEKLRYISAYALAVHSCGEVVSVGLDDIYGAAANMWPACKLTPAEY